MPRHIISQLAFSRVPPLVVEIDADCGYSNQITGIPEDDEGLDLSILRSHLEKLEKEDETEKPAWQKWTYRYVFYGVPTFSNPTGSIMSLSRRKSLIEVTFP